MNTPRSNFLNVRSGLILLGLFVFGSVGAEATMAQSRFAAIPGGVTFEIPSRFSRNTRPDFRGMLMVGGRPVGMFVTYPDENETTEALRLRLLRAIARMFNENSPLTWDERPLLSHPDDGYGRASAYYYLGSPHQIQIVIYERSTGSAPFLYGYFAMQNKWDSCPDGPFLDEQGRGPRDLEDLRNSFSK